METFTDLKQFRRIALSANKSRPDLTGLPHESVSEFLARGGKVTVCPAMFSELPTRRAMPTHPGTNRGQTLNDWRI